MGGSCLCGNLRRCEVRVVYIYGVRTHDAALAVHIAWNLLFSTALAGSYHSILRWIGSIGHVYTGW